MEIVKKIQAKSLVKAKLEDSGEFSITLACAVEYRPGVSATATLSEKDLPREHSEKIRAALKALLDAGQDQVADEAIRASAEAEAVQKRMDLVAG